MAGTAALLAALFAAALAFFYYGDAYLRSTAPRPGRTALSPRAWQLYRAAAALSWLAAGGLLYIILADQFQYAYVAGHSSRETAFFYKLPAFWAGQEGSFLLWLALHAGFGLIIGRRRAEPAVMAIYTALQVVFTVLVLAKSPFALLAEPRLNGSGLNPLLQDPWMVIHPPVVFLGYAAMAVPLAYAAAGLLTGDHKGWLGRALPWALVAWAALGAGIFIGGFWAYKVLGWGGYWAWDPVENSSLVPWLTATAFIHFALLARLQPAAVKLAFPAALISYILVLYGTFLTRSGVLSDFSVHSFSDEGVGGLLGGTVLTVAAVLAAILAAGWRRLPAGEIYSHVKSREFAVVAGGATVFILAFLVFAGMSTPLATSLAGKPQSVSPSFYNTVSQPVAAVMLVLAVVATLARWGGRDLPKMRQVWWVLVAGHLAMFSGMWLGVTGLVSLTTLMMAGGVLAASIVPRKDGGVNLAAAVGHAGLAVMVFGIIVSSAASQSTVVSLAAGESGEVLGSRVTYLGQLATEDGRGYYHSFIIDGINTVNAHTKLNNENKPAAREPAILRTFTADLYLAPVMKHDNHFDIEITLQRGEQKSEKELVIKFTKFGMARDESQALHIAALLEVTKAGERREIIPEIVSRNGQFTPVSVEAFGYRITLTSVDTAGGKIAVGLQQLDKPTEDRVDVQASRKPMVNLVWLGAALITASGCLAAWRRVTAGATEASGHSAPKGGYPK